MPGRANKLVKLMITLLKCVLVVICFAFTLLHLHTLLLQLFPVIVKTQNNDLRRFSLTDYVVSLVKFLMYSASGFNFK